MNRNGMHSGEVHVGVPVGNRVKQDTEDVTVRRGTYGWWQVVFNVCNFNIDQFVSVVL